MRSSTKEGILLENIFIAQRITAELWQIGHTVLSPHLNTLFPSSMCDIPQEEYIRRDLNIVAVCEGVVMMPDWEESEGAVTEYLFARLHNIPVWEYPEVPRAEED